MGLNDTGLILFILVKVGGFYIGMSQRKLTSISWHTNCLIHTDVGGSQYIIDGKIKLKNDSQIQGFTTNGLLFEDGSELETDVVVFCTGFVYLFYFFFLLAFFSTSYIHYYFIEKDWAMLERQFAKSVETKSLTR